MRVVLLSVTSARARGAWLQARSSCARLIDLAIEAEKDGCFSGSSGRASLDGALPPQVSKLQHSMDQVRMTHAHAPPPVRRMRRRSPAREYRHTCADPYYGAGRVGRVGTQLCDEVCDVDSSVR